jgi:methionine aminopeptidase
MNMDLCIYIYIYIYMCVCVGDNTVLGQGDVLKIDFGTQIDGEITA